MPLSKPQRLMPERTPARSKSLLKSFDGALAARASLIDPAGLRAVRLRLTTWEVRVSARMSWTHTDTQIATATGDHDTDARGLVDQQLRRQDFGLK